MNFLLIGRPNAGKSSLYNILTSGKNNIIHKEEGTTRDWHKSSVKGLENIFIYDTPGVIIENDKIDKVHFSDLFNSIEKLIYVIDFKEKNYENEIQSINKLRSLNKDIILVINKDDNDKKDLDTNLFGIKDVFYISCAHKIGIENIYEYLERYEDKIDQTKEESFSIAIFGKPNAGKSTLANSLIGYDRILTSPVAGTTSDFVEDSYIYKNQQFKILDTAGIFKKNKIDSNSINFEAIRKSLDIINKIDLSIMLIDSNNGFDSQIKKILNMLINKSRSVVIVFNKIDTIDDKNGFIKQSKLEVKETYSQTKNLSIIFISANNKFNVDKLKSTLLAKSNRIIKKISTGKLNACLKQSSLEK
ncbi:50S ribosome-binding GTPase, partial [Alphaproteobacteria bacterium]|nr:50S ribosome-binding GTPase [Alphaproteobacteria bacterium]